MKRDAILFVMSHIKGLESLFNLEKNNFKSKEDCLVTVLHTLLINEDFQCVGTGDEWPETDPVTTDLLPKNWNSSQDVYSLRYRSKDKKSRILLKATKVEHILLVDSVINEDVFATVTIPVDNYISEEYSEYSSAYKDLESLNESFRKDIIESFKPEVKKEPSARDSNSPSKSQSDYPPPYTFRPPISRNQRDPFQQPRLPRVGNRDLDPFAGPGAGGMFMDPSSFGIPSRPTLPQFGVGGFGGLPRGAVPPGARFDPFMPPIMPDRMRNPNPDHYPPPDFEDFM